MSRRKPRPHIVGARPLVSARPRSGRTRSTLIFVKRRPRAPVVEEPPPPLRPPPVAQKVSIAVYSLVIARAHVYQPPKVTTSSIMKEWIPLLPQIADAILQHECDSGIPGPCSGCGKPAAYLCDTCSDPPPMCKSCIISSHANSPFCWIKAWTGTFFQRVGLSGLGFTKTLGHRGAPCPSVPITTKPSKLVVVHTNGLHHVNVHWCLCNGPVNRRQQLLAARMFPATIKRPKTAFTFHVLKEFHIHSDISKKPLYDYVRALERLTDNAFPGTLKVTHPIPT